MDEIRLYHAGFQQLPTPDVHYGRANADFGQGFYTSPDEAFCERWARERRGRQTFVNAYCLDTAGLDVVRLARDERWFNVIDANRNLRGDALKDADVVIGPIANDTIYNVWGITTSGRLAPEQALKLMMIGPAYAQAVVKSERAAAQLKWLGARELSHGEIEGFREIVRREEEAYQEAFVAEMERLIGD